MLGVWALRQGGNAVDAAIASTLMAGVAEPLLTGLAGAGLATVRYEGQVYTVDFFANMPGLGLADNGLAPMDEVRITSARRLSGSMSDSVRLRSRVCRAGCGNSSVALVDLRCRIWLHLPRTLRQRACR